MQLICEVRISEGQIIRAILCILCVAKNQLHSYASGYKNEEHETVV